MKKTNVIKKDFKLPHSNRADGFSVFPDSDVVLNAVRLSEPDPRKIILAVALKRAQNVAESYARTHAPHLLNDVSKAMEGLFMRFTALNPSKGGRTMNFVKEGSKFNLGQVFLTRGVALECQHDPQFARFTHSCIARHSQGDWGDVNEEDRISNERSLVNGSRILSAYMFKNRDRVWIITEADRASTTVLFPSEY